MTDSSQTNKEGRSGICLYMLNMKVNSLAPTPMVIMCTPGPMHPYAHICEIHTHKRYPYKKYSEVSPQSMQVKFMLEKQESREKKKRSRLA